MIGRRETLRLAPKSFVFGLFEAIWDQNDLSHADVALRGGSDGFIGSSHTVYAFDDSQPVANDRNTTAVRVFGRSVSAPGGHSRVVEVRHDTKDPSHHRLAPSRRASGCERVREFVDAPPHGCIAESAHCLAPPRPRAHRFSRRRGAGRGRSMGRVQRDPRGVARMPLRARRGGGEELLPLPGVAQSARNRAPSRAPLREFSPGRPPTRSWSRAPGGRTL